MPRTAPPRSTATSEASAPSGPLASTESAAVPASLEAAAPVPAIAAPALPDPAQVCSLLKLRRLMRQVTQHYDNEVRASGLRTTQYSLMSQIGRLGPLRSRELAELLRMSASTLSRNLQPLVAAGWVAMEPGEDARNRLLRLTPEGLAKRREAQQHWRRAQDGFAALVGDGQVQALHSLADALSHTLAARGVDGEE